MLIINISNTNHFIAFHTNLNTPIAAIALPLIYHQFEYYIIPIRKVIAQFLLEILIF